jgi:urease accessory protein
VKASASAIAAGGPTGTRVRALRSEAPLLLRETCDALYIVGGAGGPLGGDEIDLAIDVEGGASLRVRSAAATLAQPGPSGARSVTRTRLRVGEDATLVWEPEPLVSVRRSHHVVDTMVELAAGACLHLIEEVVLGRWNEPSGRVTSYLRVARGGAPLVVHDLDLGGDAVGWASPAVVGDARAVHTEVRVGAPADPPRTLLDGSTRAAAFPVASDTTLVVALAPTLALARAAACTVALHPPNW